MSLNKKIYRGPIGKAATHAIPVKMGCALHARSDATDHHDQS